MLLTLQGRLLTLFPCDFDVVLMSLNNLEVVSRWDSSTAKAPSLQVVAWVLLQHVMGKNLGKEGAPRLQACEALGPLQSCD